VNPWFLLIATAIAAYATSVASRAAQGTTRAPFSSIQHLWKGGLSHLSVAEKDKVQQGANRYLATKIFVASAAVTVVLAAKTLRAFFPGL
jgi:hypothetical protein